MKTFEAILRKSAKKYQENHWGFHSNLMTFRDLRGIDFSNGKRQSATSKKVVQKPL